MTGHDNFTLIFFTMEWLHWNPSYCSLAQNHLNDVTQPLKWRHNEHDGVSNHQPHDFLLSRLFRRISKKTSKLRVTGLSEGNSPVTGEFPTQPVTRKMFPFDDAIMTARCTRDVVCTTTSHSSHQLMLGLHRIATNLGPIYELKNSEFLGLVSSR